MTNNDEEKIKGSEWGAHEGDRVRAIFYPIDEWQEGIVQYDDEERSYYISTGKNSVGHLHLAYDVKVMTTELQRTVRENKGGSNSMMP